MKYRMFCVTLRSGEQVEVKAPSRITEDYCRTNAWHYVRKQKGMNVSCNDVIGVKGIS